MKIWLVDKAPGSKKDWIKLNEAAEFSSLRHLSAIILLSKEKVMFSGKYGS